jgi:hypothetical protein
MSAGNRMLAHRLAMVHTDSVSQLVGAFGKDKENRDKLSKLRKMLKCET